MLRLLRLVMSAVELSRRIPKSAPAPRSDFASRQASNGKAIRADELVRPNPPSAPPPMPRLQTEYPLKGIFLGLVLFAALHLATIPVDSPQLVREALLRVNLSTLAGLGLGLLIAAVLRWKDALRAKGRLLAFLLFLLLESPTLTYIGILGGAFAGTWMLRDTLDAEITQALSGLLIPILGGAAIAGFAFGLVRNVRDNLARTGLILLLAGGLVAAALSWSGFVELSWLPSKSIPEYLKNQTAFAWQILLGIPFFYLLTFSGQEEESEIEIAAICAFLGLAMFLLLPRDPTIGSLPVLLPVVIYFVYTLRVLPGLRTLKHAFRGISYSRVGRYRRALLAFRRALQLDPNHALARDGFWEVHRSLDFDQLSKDPQTLQLVDLDLCLDRAGTLLLQKPTPAQLDEANRLLHLVLQLDPHRQPGVCYWQAVAAVHAGNLDVATDTLRKLLDPDHFGRDNPHRLAVLISAWQLAVIHHEGLRQLVGLPELAKAGRRMEAIAVVERHLSENADDAGAIALKRLLYRELDEEEYNHGAGGSDFAANFVDHAYLQHLGLALINDNERWPRGGEYLRLAARGLPALGPTLFVQIAQAQQRAGRFEEARHNYELAKRAGQGVGPTNLDEPERQAYFSTVKLLGEEALGRGDVDSAIENFRLYSESAMSGIETLRTLATLHERKGDPLAAARATDQGLQYNSKDADLLEKKDRYYYSILPEELSRRLEQYKSGFDVSYCLTRAKQVFERYSDLEWLDVAHHLTKLALIVQPENLTAKLMLARVQLRFGERDVALGILEEIRGPQKPDRFGSSDDEEAWYLCCQILADLYVEINRADLAIPCLQDFRKSSKSGAKTIFKLGQAYEAVGDIARAIKSYEQVTAYTSNPLAGDAHDALDRLRRG